MKTVLLTGATGNIGSRVLAEILDGVTTVVVLVRAASDGEAGERLERVLDFWEVPSERRANIELLRGDLSERLGLRPDAFESLGRRVTHIIHAASSVRFDMTLREARSDILQSTMHLVRLARVAASARRFVRFCYMSTMEVAGTERGVCREEFLSDDRRFLNTYEQAKFETEGFLRNEAKRGLPVTIYRPSMVVGDSSTGKILRFQTFYYLVQNYYLRPPYRYLPGPRAFRIDVVPVDAIATAVRLTYADTTPSTRIYHLTAGPDHAMTFPELLRGLDRHYTRKGQRHAMPRLISPWLFWLVMSAIYPLTGGELRRRLRAQLTLVRFLFLEMRFDNAKLVRRLEAEGRRWPRVADYLGTVLEFYDERKRSQSATAL